MTIQDRLKAVMPETLKRVIRPLLARVRGKQESELAYWRNLYAVCGNRFYHTHYERIMLAMAEETTADFLAGKVVADFGCGPRGSLVWASPARLRIGIDVLADRYVDEFTSALVSHGMIYLKSTERVIPLPSGSVDVLYTLNAIDHVDHLSTMCDELLRVLKPGGELIGSFNLEEPPSACEPQRLDEALIRASLLRKLEVRSYRITEKGPPDDLYGPFFDGRLSYRPGQEGFLWVRARKPG